MRKRGRSAEGYLSYELELLLLALIRVWKCGVVEKVVLMKIGDNSGSNSCVKFWYFSST